MPQRPCPCDCDCDDELLALEQEIEAERAQRVAEDDQLLNQVTAADAGKQNKTTISPTPPPSPMDGDTWVNETNGRRFTFVSNTWIES